jgi:acetyl esterase/lipase
VTARIISSQLLPFSIEHLVPTAATSYVSSLTKVLSSNTFSKLFAPSANVQLALPAPEQDTLPSLPVILHFHGGGFVSGSSAMHENYLREWAISTGMIVISVDYRYVN